jgi:hypothetical protein
MGSCRLFEQLPVIVRLSLCSLSLSLCSNSIAKPNLGSRVVGVSLHHLFPSNTGSESDGSLSFSLFYSLPISFGCRTHFLRDRRHPNNPPSPEVTHQLSLRLWFDHRKETSRHSTIRNFITPVTVHLVKEDGGSSSFTSGNKLRFDPLTRPRFLFRGFD